MPFKAAHPVRLVVERRIRIGARIRRRDPSAGLATRIDIIGAVAVFVQGALGGESNGRVGRGRVLRTGFEPVSQA